MLQRIHIKDIKEKFIHALEEKERKKKYRKRVYVFNQNKKEEFNYL